MLDGLTDIRLLMKQFQVIARGIVFSDGELNSQTRVACFPSLIRLHDDRILCTFRIGKSKDSANETLRIAESRDDGQSWEVMSFEPNTMLDGTAGSLRVGHIVEVAPDQLVLIASWVDRTDPDAPISHPETAGCLELKSVTFHSSDGGHTWSEMKAIETIPFPQPEISGQPILLSKPGHLLLPMENQKYFDDPHPIDEKAYALLSFDGGLTWPEWAMIAHDFPRRKFWCNRVAKFPSGKLACVSWTFDENTQRDLPLHLSFGASDGKQWSEPVSTGIHGQVSALLALDESTLLLSTSHRESPAGIRLRTSVDGGSTWDGEGVLIHDAQTQASPSGGDLGEYYQHMTEYTFGWSPMVRLRNEELLTVFFAGNSTQIDIYWARLDSA
jgi:hypothetical protein